MTNTQTDALDRLIEAVEAGYFDRWSVHGSPFTAPQKAFISRAYNGSLDAALALHEELLPGWEWRLRDDGRAWVWRTGNDVQGAEDADTTARAWLLAIIRAYRGTLA